MVRVRRADVFCDVEFKDQGTQLCGKFDQG